MARAAREQRGEPVVSGGDRRTARRTGRHSTHAEPLQRTAAGARHAAHAVRAGGARPARRRTARPGPGRHAAAQLARPGAPGRRCGCHAPCRRAELQLGPAARNRCGAHRRRPADGAGCPAGSASGSRRLRHAQQHLACQRHPARPVGGARAARGRARRTHGFASGEPRCAAGIESSCKAALQTNRQATAGSNGHVTRTAARAVARRAGHAAAVCGLAAGELECHDAGAGPVGVSQQRAPDLAQRPSRGRDERNGSAGGRDLEPDECAGGPLERRPLASAQPQGRVAWASRRPPGAGPPEPGRRPGHAIAKRGSHPGPGPLDARALGAGRHAGRRATLCARRTGCRHAAERADDAGGYRLCRRCGRRHHAGGKDRPDRPAGRARPGSRGAAEARRQRQCHSH